ncbi:hypothetical protein GKC77_03675 [Lactobacillus ruminis]|uniref:Uncharacterized protein n=1 Tax=Ligilactobacillus ruminis TaxID=1623 RepID=A0A6A8HAI1_9LACO|nr:hypothetical protein [Ligilactobacillus ruminis]MSA22391.1 hypothetical protein [Ligilactobacillus ruminis]MSA24430.1 hypothetical protein [Ligilactobacillus ruminis]MSA34647.1 hypothetical protein [Ligilactobacillus ruminis]MSA41019.1 hypothetical protein [Ligilactobacillus ruminis]
MQFNPVFCVCMTIAFHDGNIPKESASFPWIKEPKRCALSVRAAFGKKLHFYYKRSCHLSYLSYFC